MRRRALIALWVLCIGCSMAPAEVREATGWERLPDALEAVVSPAGSVSGRNLVVTGGVGFGRGVSDTVMALHLDDLTWVRTAALVEGRFQHAQVTLDDGRLLIVGGRTLNAEGRRTALASCELVSADFLTSALTDPLPRPIGMPTLTRLDDGRVMATGGASAFVYDPTLGRWTDAVTLRETRGAHATARLPDGRVMIIGGNRQGIEIVDPGLKVSTRLAAELPFAIDDAAAVPLPDGRVWVLGGQRSRGGDTTDQTWVVDPGDDGRPSRIVDGPPLEVEGGVADHRVVAARDGYVLIGGETQRAGQDTELTIVRFLDPQALTVSALPPTRVAHDDAVAAGDGNTVIVVGGLTVNRTLPGVPTPTAVAERLVLPARAR